MEYMQEVVAVVSIISLVGGVASWSYVDERNRVRKKLKEHDEELMRVKENLGKIDIVANDVKWIRKQIENGDRK